LAKLVEEKKSENVDMSNDFSV